MSDKVKTILYIVLGLITFTGAVWGASEYLHRFVEKQEFIQRTEYLSDRVDLIIIQQRMNWLQERIWEFENKYGSNCSNAPNEIKKLYMNWKNEYQGLQKKVDIIMSRGKG